MILAEGRRRSESHNRRNGNGSGGRKRRRRTKEKDGGTGRGRMFLVLSKRRRKMAVGGHWRPGVCREGGVVCNGGEVEGMRQGKREWRRKKRERQATRIELGRRQRDRHMLVLVVVLLGLLLRCNSLGFNQLR